MDNNQRFDINVSLDVSYNDGWLIKKKEFARLERSDAIQSFTKGNFLKSLEDIDELPINFTRRGAQLILSPRSIDTRVLNGIITVQITFQSLCLEVVDGKSVKTVAGITEKVAGHRMVFTELEGKSDVSIHQSDCSVIRRDLA